MEYHACLRPLMVLNARRMPSSPVSGGRQRLRTRRLADGRRAPAVDMGAAVSPHQMWAPVRLRPRGPDPSGTQVQ